MAIRLEKQCGENNLKKTRVVNLQSIVNFIFVIDLLASVIYFIMVVIGIQKLDILEVILLLITGILLYFSRK